MKGLFGFHRITKSLNDGSPALNKGFSPLQTIALPSYSEQTEGLEKKARQLKELEAFKENDPEVIERLGKVSLLISWHAADFTC